MWHERRSQTRNSKRKPPSKTRTSARTSLCTNEGMLENAARKATYFHPTIGFLNRHFKTTQRTNRHYLYCNSHSRICNARSNVNNKRSLKKHFSFFNRFFKRLLFFFSNVFIFTQLIILLRNNTLSLASQSIHIARVCTCSWLTCIWFIRVFVIVWLILQ